MPTARESTINATSPIARMAVPASAAEPSEFVGVFQLTRHEADQSEADQARSEPAGRTGADGTELSVLLAADGGLILILGRTRQILCIAHAASPDCSSKHMLPHRP